MPVVDASVLVAARVSVDAHFALARSWLAAEQRQLRAFICPTIVLPEVAGPIRRVTGSESEAQESVRQLLDPRIVQLEAVTPDRARRAAELALRLSLRGCDAVYVALAQELDDVLVTFDEEQLARAGAAVTVLRPV
jgi:predicted nucleic acid-binding protein